MLYIGSVRPKVKSKTCKPINMNRGVMSFLVVFLILYISGLLIVLGWFLFAKNHLIHAAVNLPRIDDKGVCNRRVIIRADRAE